MFLKVVYFFSALNPAGLRRFWFARPDFRVDRENPYLGSRVSEWKPDLAVGDKPTDNNCHIFCTNTWTRLFKKPTLYTIFMHKIFIGLGEKYTTSAKKWTVRSKTVVSDVKTTGEYRIISKKQYTLIGIPLFPYKWWEIWGAGRGGGNPSTAPKALRKKTLFQCWL